MPTPAATLLPLLPLTLLMTTKGDRTGAGAAAAVRHDETRLFHVALTRASHHVVVTAVAAEDEQPSVYLDLVDPPDLFDGGVLGARPQARQPI